MNNIFRRSLRTVLVVFLAECVCSMATAQIQAEYFIDDDPGLGRATPIDINDDGLIEANLPTEGLAPGYHLLGMRSYTTQTGTDDANQSVVITRFSPTVIRSFSVTKEQVSQEILYAEYFIGDDPGYGKGTAVTLSAGGEVNFDNLDISTEGLLPGQYQLGFRTYGTSGWSPTVIRNFTVIEEKQPQEILYAEYFIGDDPGYGKGTFIALSAGGEVNFDNLNISTEGLLPGQYLIGFRTYGTSGWSPTIIRNFTVLEEKQPQEVIYAEYFIGNDPGYGKGTVVALSAGDDVNFDNLDISTEGLSPGQYLLGFRTYGTSGWSPTVICNFTVLEEKQSQEILYAEYFIDEDPGYGKGTAVAVSADGEVNFDKLDISTEGLSPGQYILGFRTYGTSGWSPTVIRNFTVMEERQPQEILYAEYFIDDDPGYGKGTAVAVSADGEVNFDNLDISTEGLSPGQYILGFRTQGTSGWSPTVIRNFTVMEERQPQEILYAEYFLNEDPGYGKGTPVKIVPGKEVTVNDIELPPNTRFHVFGFRTLGTTGWSPTIITCVDADIYGDNIEVVRETTATYHINLANGKNVGSMDMTLTLPEGVSMEMDSRGRHALTASTRLDGYDLQIEDLSNNSYHISAVPSEGKFVAPGDGAIITVNLLIDEDIPSGAYDLSLTDISVVLQPDGTTLPLDDTVSELKIRNFLPGDVNDDGDINITDVVCIISWILGEDPPVFINEAADYNHDGRITVTDVSALIDYLLNGSSSSNMHQFFDSEMMGTELMQ